MTIVYLRIGSDTLDEAYACHTVEDAVRSYRTYVEYVGRFQQPAEASIHIPDNAKASIAARPDPRERLNEYPDYVLSVGPRGGIRKEPT